MRKGMGSSEGDERGWEDGKGWEDGGVGGGVQRTCWRRDGRVRLWRLLVLVIEAVFC